jgi:outer membrane immunogenic protein
LAEGVYAAIMQILGIRIRLVLGSSLLALIFASPAVAAPKKPQPVPPAPVYNWNGFYVGGNAGGTWSDSNVTVSSSPVFNALPFAGGPAVQATITSLANFAAPVGKASFIGGAQIGYNQQVDPRWIAGVEADIQGIASPTRTATSGGSLVVAGFPQSIVQSAAVSSGVDYLGTVRGRLGYLVTPTLLVYGTGGLAYGGARANTNITQALVPNSITTGVWSGTGGFSDTRVGWAVGSGLEWMIFSKWSAKVEYLFYDLGSVTYAASPLVTIAAGGPFTVNTLQSSTRFDGQIVRGGLNYHF